MGLSLDGWRDFGTRDWDIEDHDVALADPHTVEGGVGGVVIALGEGGFVGGPQAMLAPHGRGVGWGEIGDPVRRVALRDAIRRLVLGTSETEDPPRLLAAAEALTREAESVMLAVPDRPEFAEGAQGRFLAALRGRRAPHARLLWRSVAIFHEACARGVLRPKNGHALRVLVHSADGFESQRLRFAEADGYADHLAPLREGYGSLIWPELGLQAAFSRAEEAIRPLHPELAEGKTERSRLPHHLLCGMCGVGQEELLRRNFGGWIRIEAPHLPPASILPAVALAPFPDDCDSTVLITPLGGAYAERLRDLVATRLPAVTLGGSDWAARGALRAARVLERGLPHYLDRLEPISLAVLTPEGARWEMLTPKGRHVPANEEFVSRALKGFSIRKGQAKTRFYVLKGDDEVRSWAKEFDEAADREASVELQLRQLPGQSWARLVATSPDWEPLRDHPIRLDWETLEVDERTPDEILRTLEPQAPKFPVPVVEPADAGFWTGQWETYNWRGVGVVLDEDGDEDDLYGALSDQRRASVATAGRRPRFHPISTDGALPGDLPERWRLAFEARMAGIAGTLEERIAAGHVTEENRGFLCLAWTFTRCPERLQDHILEALAAHNMGWPHPLFAMTTAQRIIQFAAGRTVSGERRVRQALSLLAERPVPNMDTFAALSYILSRRKEAPLALDAALATRLSRLLLAELRELNRARNYKRAFVYVIEGLSGMLRYREREPYALVVGKDPVAADLVRELERARERLQATARGSAQAKRNRDFVEELIAFFEGTGGDPELLWRIADAS